MARYRLVVRWRRWLRRAVLTLTVLATVLLAPIAVLMLITPSVGDAERIAQIEASRFHSAFPGPPVPARFAAALIATEDHRFASEPGVDPLAIGRVLLGGLTGRGGQGGATLYQQLAKLLYTPEKGGLKIEIEQIALAIKLRYTYTRPQILRMYADVAYFGNGYYGLRAASCGYFGREPGELSWPQAAVLAGLVQAPSAYDPLVHPALARSRETHVIARLVATDVLSSRQGAAALAVPLRQLLAGARGCHAVHS
jgi:membrane peptidoglycan carboxypeptidase